MQSISQAGLCQALVVGRFELAIYVFSVRYAHHFNSFLSEVIGNAVASDAESPKSFELALQGDAHERITGNLAESFLKNIFERRIRCYKLAGRIREINGLWAFGHGVARQRLLQTRKSARL